MEFPFKHHEVPRQWEQQPIKEMELLVQQVSATVSTCFRVEGSPSDWIAVLLHFISAQQCPISATVVMCVEHTAVDCGPECVDSTDAFHFDLKGLASDAEPHTPNKFDLWRRA